MTVTIDSHVFMPACIIDGRRASMKQMVGTLVSIIKQTVIPPQISIIVDSKTYIDLDTFNDIIKSHDGTIIKLSCRVDDYKDVSGSYIRGNYDIPLLHSIKSFKYIVGKHKKTQISKRFPVTHVMVIIAGHILPKQSNNLIERLGIDWGHGIHYDVMFLKMRYGKVNLSGRSCIFYLPSVRLLCKKMLWEPIQKRQQAFDKHKPEKDMDFNPMRICKYGVLSTI